MKQVTFKNRLKNLFDYQRFEQNPDIEAMVKEIDQDNHCESLSEKELSMVYAAGDHSIEPELFTKFSSKRRSP